MVKTNKANLANIIMNNARIFAHGSIFSADVLDTMFGIEIPNLTTTSTSNEIFVAINKRNLKRLTAYTKLNKMLAERGISMHQKTDTAGFVTYHVRTVAELPKDVIYYRKKGKRATKRSRILLTAYNQSAIPGIE